MSSDSTYIVLSSSDDEENEGQSQKAIKIFEQFLEKCLQVENSDEMRIIVSKLRSKYEKASPKHRESDAFVSMVQGKLSNLSSCTFMKIKEIMDFLQFHKEVTRDTKPISDPCSSKQADDRDRKIQKHIRKLEKMLKKLHKRIRYLEAEEVSWSDDEDSAYIQLSRYRTRFDKVFKKLCELERKPANAGRVYLQRLKFSGTNYPPLNRALERLYNESREFPDYIDVLNVVKQFNEEGKLNLNSAQQESLATDAFSEIGNTLQERRRRDVYDTIAGYISDESDPAEHDAELQKKLEENKQHYQKELEVLDLYAAKQSEVVDNEDDIDNKDSTDTSENELDDEEEEEDDQDQLKDVSEDIASEDSSIEDSPDIDKKIPKEVGSIDVCYATVSTEDNFNLNGSMNIMPDTQNEKECPKDDDAPGIKINNVRTDGNLFDVEKRVLEDQDPQPVSKKVKLQSLDSADSLLLNEDLYVKHSESKIVDEQIRNKETGFIENASKSTSATDSETHIAKTSVSPTSTGKQILEISPLPTNAEKHVTEASTSPTDADAERGKPVDDDDDILVVFEKYVEKKPAASNIKRVTSSVPLKAPKPSSSASAPSPVISGSSSTMPIWPAHNWESFVRNLAVQYGPGKQASTPAIRNVCGTTSVGSGIRNHGFPNGAQMQPRKVSVQRPPLMNGQRAPPVIRSGLAQNQSKHGVFNNQTQRMQNSYTFQSRKPLIGSQRLSNNQQSSTTGVRTMPTLAVKKKSIITTTTSHSNVNSKKGMLGDRASSSGVLSRQQANSVVKSSRPTQQEVISLLDD